MNTQKFHNPFLKVGLGRELDYFIENISMLVAAGMPIASALDSIAQEVRSRRMRRAISILRTDIEGGMPMWAAIEKSRLFRDHVISLLRIGEESGRLVENLKVIAIEEQKDSLFRSKLRSAMMYPLFVFSVTVVVGIGIAWFILPKLALVFSQLKIQLPIVTRALIRAGTFLGAHGRTVVPAVIVFFVLLFYFVFSFSKTKILGQYIVLFLPGIRKLTKEVEMARFGYLLGTLLEAGLPVVSALDSLSGATESLPYRKLYRHIRDSVEEGNSFQKSFASIHYTDRLIPVPIQQLIVAGERSGNLSATLLKIGAMFEGKADSTTKNLSVILEPILLVVVWVGVVAVALAVILPIYSLIGGLNQQ